MTVTNVTSVAGFLLFSVQWDNSTNDPGMPRWARNVEISYLIVIALIGIPGNIMILLVQKRNRGRNSTDVLIAAMAMYELVCSSLNVTIKIIMNTYFWRYIASNHVCCMQAVLVYLTTFSSTYLLAAIAVDRYVKTCKPLSGVYTVRTSKYVCAVVSVAGFLTGLSTIWTYHLDQYYECVVKEQQLQLQHYWDVAVTTSIALVFVIFTICYLSIALSLRKRVLVRKQDRVPLQEQSSGHSSQFRLSNIINRLRRFKVQPRSPNQEAGLSTSSVPHQSQNRVQEQTSDSCEVRVASNVSITDVTNPREHPQPTEAPAQSTDRGPRIDGRTTLVERTLNRTTKIMFVLSVFYVVVWSVVCACVMTSDAVLGLIMEKMSRTVFMVNCITNPLLFFTMSSKYRNSAKHILLKRRR